MLQMIGETRVDCWIITRYLLIAILCRVLPMDPVSVANTVVLFKEKPERA